MAYLLKDRVGDRAELLRAIHETIARGSVIDPEVVDGLGWRTAIPAMASLDRLTPRELDVLRQMTQRRSNTAIAPAMNLSGSAVEKQIGSIFLKLDLARSPDIHRLVAAVLTLLHGLGDG